MRYYQNIFVSKIDALCSLIKVKLVKGNNSQDYRMYMGIVCVM